MPNSKMISKKSLLFYALPAIPLALLGLPLYIYLPTFYAQTQGMGVFAVGAVLLFARLLDMIIDPFIGRLSDRYFKRQTMMLIGAAVLIVGFYFLIHPIKDYQTVWLLVFSLCVYTGWSLMTIPYFALSAELSPHYHDNTKLASWRESFTILGVLLALLLPYFFKQAQDPEASLQLIYLSLLLLLPVMMLFFIWGLKENKPQSVIAPMLDSFKKFWISVKSAKQLFIAFLLNNLANAIPATLFLLYVELVIKRPELTGMLLLLYFFAGIIGLPVWLKISMIYGKKLSWMLSMFWASLFFAFIPFLGEGDVVLFALITFFSGLSLGADMALPAAIQSDIAQASRQEGNDFSGVLFGLWAMLTKLALALSVGISFMILGLVDFEPKSPTVDSLFVLSLLYGTLPVLLKLVALVSMRTFKEDLVNKNYEPTS